LLLWHLTCIFLLLLGCWKLGRLCFGTNRAASGSAALVAVLLTLPVSGTALYLMDQYLNTRSFSTVAAVWLILEALERRYVRAVVWLVFAAVIHPLMAGFAFIFAAILVWRDRVSNTKSHAAIALTFPLGFFPPVSDAYRQVLDRHPYFFLLRWQWYEWLGFAGPLLIFWLFARMAHRRKLHHLEALSAATALFGALFLVASLAITVPVSLMRFVELQPMRSLHLVYLMLCVVAGGFVAEHLLKTKAWRWIALFVPLSVGMFYAQRQLYPATEHVERPGADSRNQWVQAFRWIRNNTPTNAYFALDPDYMILPGEDQHGFRAIAERSRLADQVKDSGAVTMFPALAQVWRNQTDSEKDWDKFIRPDFDRLRLTYGVNWIVMRRAETTKELDCPYQRANILVCRLEESLPHSGTVK
jgi:hypothetical protein